MKMLRIFMDWGEAGALMFFDVPSILIGFFSGVIITLLVWVLITLWRRKK